MRHALAVTGRIAVLTFVTALWWIAGLSVQSGYGLPVLDYTETVKTVATASAPLEILRGLGNWFFYGRDGLGPWIEQSAQYQQDIWLLVVSFLVPILAFVVRGVHAVAAPGLLRRAGRHRHGHRGRPVPLRRPVVPRPAVQVVRRRLDGRARAAQHAAGRSAGGARPRGAARRGRRRVAPRAHRRRDRRRGRRRRARDRQPPARVGRRLHRVEPEAARGHPHVLDRRGEVPRRAGELDPRARAARLRLLRVPVGQHRRPAAARARCTARTSNAS